MSDSITPRYETIPIFKPDDHARLLELDEAREAARDGDPDGLLADEDPSEAANAAYEEFYAEALERADAIVKVRNIGNKKWREIRRKYPPRKDVPFDSLVGFNTEEAFDEMVPACMVSPTFETDAERDAFIDSIPYGQWGEVATATTRVNQDNRLPKAPSERR